MSILLKWKNKLQDPSLYETKIREFDERVSHLKNENVELHKRIDHLEAMCATSVDSQQTNNLEEHIQQLRQENGRLFAENQYQRQEYERFLDQLTSMVLRTAVMQENIRKECASIYHVIERISTLTTNSIEDQHSDHVQQRSKRLRSLSWENFTEAGELMTTYPFLTNSSEITSEFIQQLYRNRSLLSRSISSASSSSSTTTSCSSATTHCSFSTSGSWTLDLSFDKKPKAIELPIETDDKKQLEQEPQLVLQRSETFTVNKLPQEEADASPSPIKPMTTNSQTFKPPNVQRCSTTRTMASTNTSVVRPSRLPSRCSTNRNTNSTPSKPLSSNTNSKIDTRSSSIKKVSKLPIRTMNQPTKQQITPVKKSNVTTSVASKTKKDATIPTSTRAVTSMNSSSTKRIIRPPTITKPSVTQTSSSTSKFRSRSITTVNNKTNMNSSIPMPINKRTRTTPPAVKKVTNEPTVPAKKSTKSNDESTNCSMEKMNSTSSESSIEEKRQTNKILAIVQDEGYSTWSSSDVKDETNSKKALPEERRRNTGLVKNWLDTSNQRCSTKPVNEVEFDKLEEFTRELSDGLSIHCPFVRTRCSNGIIIPLASTTISTSPLPEKDISIDSLEGAAAATTTSSQRNDSTSSSTTPFSRSETFEKLLTNTSLPNITDSNLTDSTDSTSSDLNQLFHLSEYIEDNLLEQTDNCIPPLPILNNKKFIPKIKPQKRLMFPGLFNQLIFLRRVLSDSDLRQKVCYFGENQTQSHVYHANAINEHSIELNLVNTYGSDSELHVWSHDCAEQRRFLNERQQQLIMTDNPGQDKLSHIERMIRMTFDNSFEDEFDHHDYDQQLAIERQTLLQQIYEYPWLLQDDDLDQTTAYPSPTSDQPLLSPTPDLVVPSHNPDFYQLCALTNSSSFATSYGTNSRHTTPPIASSVL